MYGLKGLDEGFRSVKIISQLGKLKLVFDDISSRFDEYSLIQGLEGVPSDYARFIESSRRGTTDTGARIYRSNFVCSKITEAL